MSQQRKIILVATVALILGVIAFVPISDLLATEQSRDPRVGDWNAADIHPHFPRIHVRTPEYPRDSFPDVFVLNAFAVEAVFFAPREDPTLLGQMGSRLAMLECSGWAQSLETTPLWDFLSADSVRYGRDLVPVAWRVGKADEPNDFSRTPETCIKLRSCRIICDRPD